MTYQVINTACTTPQQLMSEISNFVTKQAGFSDKGEFLQISPANVNRSFLAPDGWYHNVEIDPVRCALMSNYSKNKPTGLIGNFRENRTTANRFANPLAYENGVAMTLSISYPLVSRHFFTNGKLVAIVIETRAGEFRHHVFGTLETYGDPGGGQWAAGSSPSTSNGGQNYNYKFSPKTSSKEYLADASSDDPYLGYKGDATPFTETQNVGFSYINSLGSTVRADSYVNLILSVIRGGDDSLTCLHNYSITQYMIGSKNYRAVLLPPYFNHYGANLYNGRSQIYPFLVYAELQKASSMQNYNMSSVNLQPRYYSDMLGYCDVTHLEPATVVNNEWVVFPLSTKSNTMTETLRSNGFGVAYRK